MPGDKMVVVEQIGTERLTLRPFTLADVVPVFVMSREEGVKKWIPDPVYSDEQAAGEALHFLIEQYQRDDAPRCASLVLAVEERRSGNIIGHVGLNPYRGMVEIGYAIGSASQGNGFATEAVRAMTCWALDTKGLGEIWGITHLGEPRSCRACTPT